MVALDVEEFVGNASIHFDKFQGVSRATLLPSFVRLLGVLPHNFPIEDIHLGVLHLCFCEANHSVQTSLLMNVWYQIWFLLEFL